MSKCRHIAFSLSTVFLKICFGFLGLNPDDYISPSFTKKMENDKLIARGYKVKVPSSVPPAETSEPAETSDPAEPPASEDLLDDGVFEVGVVDDDDDMALLLESDDDQNHGSVTADMNNSFEMEEPTARKAGVGRRVLPSRTDVRSTPVTDRLPVASRYVDIQDC